MTPRGPENIDFGGVANKFQSVGKSANREPTNNRTILKFVVKGNKS